MPVKGRAILEEAGVSPNETYDRDFYHRQSGRSIRAARSILPHVLHAVGPPETVLDMGCGLGAWLRALQDQVPGARIRGIDRPGIPRDLLMISSDEFIGKDLGEEIDLGSRFDLVISLEVAEHLDEMRAAVFVNNLTRHSDVILFSAAVPGQGGQGHVNERWPNYWIDLFAQEGFSCNDIIRPKIWDNAEIPFWYRQNIILFTRGRLTLHGEHRSFGGASLVHPELFVSPPRRPVDVREALQALKKATLRRLWRARQGRLMPRR